MQILEPLSVPAAPLSDTARMLEPWRVPAAPGCLNSNPSAFQLPRAAKTRTLARSKRPGTPNLEPLHIPPTPGHETCAFHVPRNVEPRTLTRSSCVCCNPAPPRRRSRPEIHLISSRFPLFLYFRIYNTRNLKPKIRAYVGHRKHKKFSKSASLSNDTLFFSKD